MFHFTKLVSTACLFLSLNGELLKHSTLISATAYQPVHYPEETDIAKILCNNHCVDKKDSYNNSCFENVMTKSQQVFTWMNQLPNNVIHTTGQDSSCHRPEEAFRKSMISRGDTTKLAKFWNKLQSCEHNQGVTISIVVFGGSETAGAKCSTAYGEPPPTDFLKLPKDLSIPVKLGDNKCPWSNRLYTFLTEAYPKCAHIDVYNLAHSGTNQDWALGRVREYFSLKNGARGGNTLGSVVDLVLVDFGVNDGFVAAGTLKTLNLPATEDNFLARQEAITEYLIQFITKLPSEPALLYVETAAPETLINPSLAHLDAAQRHGIPAVSVRHTMSYPDRADWTTFYDYQKDSTKPIVSKFGMYAVSDGSGGHAYSAQSFSLHPLKEIKTESGNRHSYINCWNYHTHPKEAAHVTIAKNVFYFLEVVGTAAGNEWTPSLITSSSSSSHIENCDESQQVRKSVVPTPSPQAVSFSPILNPFTTCPKGSLVYYDSDLLYHQGLDVNHFGNNEASDWAIVEDRPGKFGYIIEKATGNEEKDTIQFNMMFSNDPYLTIEFMHSYENAGKVLITIEQDTTLLGGNKDAITITTTTTITPASSVNTITPTSSLILDSYDPTTHHAFNAEYEIKPYGFQAGEVIVKLELLELSEEDLAERGGNRFKAGSIRSC